MKTKPVLTLFAALAAAGSVHAQGINTYWYRAEGRSFFEVSNCPPLSGLQFYSREGGGRQLMAVRTDQQGYAKLAAQDGFAPQLVVNPKMSGGNDGAALIGLPAFTFSDLQLSNEAGSVRITWKGSAAAGNISYEVLKSTAGASYEVLSVFKGVNSAEAPFVFSEKAGRQDVHYKIRVLDGSEEKYASRILSLRNEARVYPTQVTRVVNIELNLAAPATATYTIINSAGQSVGAGSLSEGLNPIQLSAAPAGNYTVSIKIGNEISSHKIVRL